jgi:FkbM family methyltransferase
MCPWVGGTRLLVGLGDTGLTGNLYAGLHDFSDMGYVLHCLRSGDLFVDVGANAGAYSVLACGAAGASGLAFEPVPEAFERLSDNVRLNGLDTRLACRRLALAAAPGRLHFTASQDTVNHALASGEARDGAIEVRASTLDHELDGRVPGLIKIDVEGYESQVLAGAEQTLGHSGLHSLIVELGGCGIRYGSDDAATVAGLAGCGFRPFAYDPLTRALRPMAAPPLGGNALFVRDEALVRRRLAEAPRFQVLGVVL